MSADPLNVQIVSLPIAFDMGATVLFSITGATVAIRRHYDAIGIFVLAISCALGGGLLRDGLFIQSGPPMAMRNASYMIAVMAGCVLAVLFFKYVDRFSKPFLIMDALATGAYGVVGASIALDAGLANLACVYVGVANAVGGGLIRDILVREEPLMFKPGQYYIVASVLGVFGFIVLVKFLGFPVISAGLIAILITFMLRLLAIVFDWRTRSVMRMLERNLRGK